MDFRKISEYQIFMKIRPVEVELFHAHKHSDRQIKHDETDSRFSQFCEGA
jgi:hypothetical protein